jgi:hypothetical protein
VREVEVKYMVEFKRAALLNSLSNQLNYRS